MSLDFKKPVVPAQGDPGFWLSELFASKAAREGQVIRRQTRDIERFVGWDRFPAALGRRGYRAVENCGQVVIFFNNAPIRQILVRPPE